MSETNPRIERMLHELRAAPSPRLLEELFLASGPGLRRAGAFAERIRTLLPSSGSEPDALPPHPKESP